jgi:hypothetical protein
LRLLFSDKAFYAFIERVISYVFKFEEDGIKAYIEAHHKTISLVELGVEITAINSLPNPFPITIELLISIEKTRSPW